jgi:hypothetical protein
MGTEQLSIQETVRTRLDRIHAELATVEAELWLIALATLTIDVYLTYRGLQSGLSEGNPVMRAAFDTMGFAALGLVKALVLGVAGFYRELRPEFGAVIALGLAIPWLVAISVNASLLL